MRAAPGRPRNDWTVTQASVVANMKRAIRNGTFILRAGTQMGYIAALGGPSGLFCDLDLHREGVPQLCSDGNFTVDETQPATVEGIRARLATYPEAARFDDLCMDIESTHFNTVDMPANLSRFQTLTENWAAAVPGAKRGFFGYPSFERRIYNVYDNASGGFNTDWLAAAFASVPAFLQSVPVDIMYPGYYTVFQSLTMWQGAVIEHLRRLKAAVAGRPIKIVPFLFPVYYSYQDPVTHQYVLGGESPRDQLITSLFIDQLLTLYTAGADGAVVWVDPSWKVKDFPWWLTFRNLFRS